MLLLSRTSQYSFEIIFERECPHHRQTLLCTEKKTRAPLKWLPAMVFLFTSLSSTHLRSKVGIPQSTCNEVVLKWAEVKMYEQVCWFYFFSFCTNCAKLCPYIQCAFYLLLQTVQDREVCTHVTDIKVKMNLLTYQDCVRCTRVHMSRAFSQNDPHRIFQHTNNWRSACYQILDLVAVLCTVATYIYMWPHMWVHLYTLD